jgi:disulfide bond formation protein DsbB
MAEPGAPLLSPARAAIIALGLAVVAILSALFIQYGLGVLPCELCLKQRIPYYTGIPVAVLAALMAARAPRGAATKILLLAVAVIFAIGAGLGLYHSGVEWGFWAGPTDCTGPVGQAVGLDTFLKNLETTKVVRCDEVAMRLLGLSLATWNMIAAAAVSLVALAGVRASRVA